jgi:glycerol-3-phosphate dehydrogenase
MTTTNTFDLLIIGGGINGCGIAADAAGRGLTVLLAEKSDLAQATSSSSSKLIHGGLRYLEHYEFRLVREALAEREVLLRKAPHIIWPMRFVLPHVPGLRPKWMVRAGLFLYDNLYRRETIQGSKGISLKTDPMGAPLKPAMTSAFSYWDCWVDDARLVLLNAMAARAKGAEVLTRTAVTALNGADGHWTATLEADGAKREVRARAVVNAAGPWVDRLDALARGLPGPANTSHIRLIKGSHIVVPRIPGANDAYMLQNADKRIVFVLPYEENFSIIGTTDVPYAGDPAAVAISADEETYLLDLANTFFTRPLTRDDIRWRYSGVRPLYDDNNDDPSAVTRDYHLELTKPEGRAPMLSIYGGKVTTYRRLAEEALERLRPHLPAMGAAWTAKAVLPGGDLAAASFDAFLADLKHA